MLQLVGRGTRSVSLRMRSFTADIAITMTSRTRFLQRRGPCAAHCCTIRKKPKTTGSEGCNAVLATTEVGGKAAQ